MATVFDPIYGVRSGATDNRTLARDESKDAIAGTGEAQPVGREF
jgi:hypothetical protein